MNIVSFVFILTFSTNDTQRDIFVNLHRCYVNALSHGCTEYVTKSLSLCGTSTAHSFMLYSSTSLAFFFFLKWKLFIYFSK